MLPILDFPESVRFHGRDPLGKRFTHRSRRSTATILSPFVEGDGLEPGPEAALPIVGKLGHLRDEQAEDILHQIGGVGILQADLPRPRVDQRRVEIDEPRPCLLVHGLFEALEETDRCNGHARALAWLPRPPGDGLSRTGGILNRGMARRQQARREGISRCREPSGTEPPQAASVRLGSPDLLQDFATGSKKPRTENAQGAFVHSRFSISIRERRISGSFPPRRLLILHLLGGRRRRQLEYAGLRHRHTGGREISSGPRSRRHRRSWVVLG